MVFLVVPHVLREGTAFPLLPCKRHIPTFESMLGPSHDHHFLGDGHACVMCKHLALLLLAPVDGEWKVGINSLVEMGDVVVKIRLADLGICNVDVGDKLPIGDSIEAFSWIIKGGIVNVIDRGCKLVPCDGVDNHVRIPSLASRDVVGTMLLAFGCSCTGHNDGVGRQCSQWNRECCTIAL